MKENYTAPKVELWRLHALSFLDNSFSGDGNVDDFGNGGELGFDEFGHPIEDWDNAGDGIIQR